MILSVILLVGAIVYASVLAGGCAGDPVLKSSDTVTKLSKVEQAMVGFMARNGRRPCPADGQYDVNTANFGKEAANQGSCTGGTPAADFIAAGQVMTGNTTSGSTVVTGISSTSTLLAGMAVSGSGIAGETSIAGINSATQVTLTLPATATASGVTLTFAGSVVGGVIPTKSLGLSDDYAFDQWGRRITYVVDTRATQNQSCVALEGLNAITPARHGQGRPRHRKRHRRDAAQ